MLPHAFHLTARLNDSHRQEVFPFLFFPDPISNKSHSSTPLCLGNTEERQRGGTFPLNNEGRPNGNFLMKFNTPKTHWERGWHLNAEPSLNYNSAVASQTDRLDPSDVRSAIPLIPNSLKCSRCRPHVQLLAPPTVFFLPCKVLVKKPLAVTPP